ncbi:hypothetical protein Tco_0250886 [Tanacetum coccineum]
MGADAERKMYVSCSRFYLSVILIVICAVDKRDVESYGCRGQGVRASAGELLRREEECNSKERGDLEKGVAVESQGSVGRETSSERILDLSLLYNDGSLSLWATMYRCEDIESAGEASLGVC